ncbi:MAG: hypothetical protein IT355_04825 [Gemmatimonadaceae bacterium]|nr:hypothetical protein [Gemmatimonadaceae bacterium]
MIHHSTDASPRTSRGRWMAARARNLVHRSGVLVGVGGVTFTLAFGLLLWFTRAERDALQRVPAPVDTLDLARQATSMRRLQFRADSILAEAAPARRIVVPSAPATGSTAPVDSAAADRGRADTAGGLAGTSPQRDSAAAGVRVVPDSIRLAVAALTARLERAQNAPLAASWRALAADPMLQEDPQVRALADSLADAERSRNDYDAIGGVDPIYLELSSRVTAHGRAIERIASTRIAALMRGAVAVSVARTGPSAVELARRFSGDSARHATAVARRNEAARVADSIESLLSARRAEVLQRTAARVRAQRRVDALAPPLAMLAASAAAAIGLALLVTLLLELRAPRLSDDLEITTQARVPVLLSIRATDAVTPDALTSAFSQLAFDLQDALLRTRTLIIAGDDAMLATRTAARVAERLVYEGRSVRVVSAPLVDDRALQRVTPRARAGRPTPINAQSVLVYPQRDEGMAWTGEFVRDALPDDAITIRSGSLDDVRPALVSGEGDAQVILVVRTGSTPTAWLERARAEIHRTRGTQALGVVSWAPEIEDTDPVTFALDKARQHTRPPVIAAAR